MGYRGKKSELHQHPTRKYWYSTIDGHKRSFGKDKKQAIIDFELALAQAEKEKRGVVSDNEEPASKRKRIKIAELVRRFLDYISKKSDTSTPKWYRVRLQQFLKYLGNNNIYADTITPETCELFVYEKKGYSNAYYQARKRCLKAVFLYAIRNDLLKKSPATGEAFSVGKYEPVDERDIPTDETIDKFVDYLKQHAETPELLHLSNLIRFLRLTGCRLNEARTARVEQFKNDKEGARIELSRVQTKAYRKRKKKRTIYLKTEAKELVVDLVKDKDGKDLIFHHPLRNPTSPWLTDTINDTLDRVENKLKRKLILRNIRHRFISDWAEKKKSMLHLKEITGHSDLTMISEVYARISKQSIFDELNS